MVNDDRETLLRLAFSGLNPMTVGRIVQAGAVRSARVRSGTWETVRRAMARDPAELERQLDHLHVDFLTQRDPRFPSWLASMPDAPLWLFVSGSLSEAAGVAIVGSRRATRYGLDVARRLAVRSAGASVAVVSGMAAGIDGAAHRGALEAGGYTVAVLGSGIDVWYPARHRGLARDIIEGGGAIVSEYPPGSEPEPWRFPLRNRIIAGLSRAVVVVEAAERSGALITARLALEQNLDVFAVPGDVTRATSRGCNQLIRDGAHPLTGVDDVVEALGWVTRPPRDSVVGLAPGSTASIDDLLAGASDSDASNLLERLGRLEMDGAIRIVGDVIEVLPHVRGAGS